MSQLYQPLASTSASATASKPRGFRSKCHSSHNQRKVPHTHTHTQKVLFYGFVWFNFKIFKLYLNFSKLGFSIYVIVKVAYFKLSILCLMNTMNIHMIMNMNMHWYIGVMMYWGKGDKSCMITCTCIWFGCLNMDWLMNRMNMLCWCFDAMLDRLLNDM